MVLFAKLVNAWKPFTVVAESSLLDVLNTPLITAIAFSFFIVSTFTFLKFILWDYLYLVFEISSPTIIFMQNMKWIWSILIKWNPRRKSIFGYGESNVIMPNQSSCGRIKFRWADKTRVAVSNVMHFSLNWVSFGGFALVSTDFRSSESKFSSLVCLVFLFLISAAFFNVLLPRFIILLNETVVTIVRFYFFDAVG